MASTSQLISESQSSIIKLKDALAQLSSRTSNDSNMLLSEALTLFKDFYNSLSEAQFKPQELITGDTPSSEIYNSNLEKIYSDINRFYIELKNLSKANNKAFNYSQVAVEEVKKRADALASMVLDLNILNNFTRGDVIVAGDDFINQDFIDKGAIISSVPAEPVSNGAGISLARSTSINLSTNPFTKIDVFPIAPEQGGQDVQGVNTKPTPGNFNRFYEGNYYNFLGAARPEGGEFNIQFIMEPPPPIVEDIVDDPIRTTNPGTDKQKIAGRKKPEGPPPPPTSNGVFLEYGASEEAKQQNRKNMLDGNPDTFWECEYVVKLTNPLIPDPTDSMVVDESVENPEGSEYSNPEAPDTASIQIDVNDLNTKALSEDVLDLIIDIVITLPEEQNVNFVSINPVVFSKNAFIDVVDIATIGSSEGEFKTVDGWDTIRFPKTITPEANEYLTDSQLSATLSPSRYNYTGQGIYPFPTRIAKKIKVRLSMSQPASQTYEKTYALLKNTIDVTTTITTTVTKGRFR